MFTTLSMGQTSPFAYPKKPTFLRVVPTEVLLQTILVQGIKKKKKKTIHRKVNRILM